MCLNFHAVNAQKDSISDDLIRIKKTDSLQILTKDNALSIFKTQKEALLYADKIFLRGQVYFEQYEFEPAYIHIEKASLIYNELGLLKKRTACTVFLWQLLLRNELREEAAQKKKTLVAFYKDQGDYCSLLTMYLYESIFLINDTNGSELLAIIEKLKTIQDLCDSKNAVQRKTIAALNTLVYCRINDSTNARVQLSELEKNDAMVTDAYVNNFIYLAQLTYYMSYNQTDKALSVFQEYDAITKTPYLNKHIFIIEELASELYKTLGNTHLEKIHFNNHMEFKRDYYNRISINKYDYFEYLFQVKQKELEIARQSGEIQQLEAEKRLFKQKIIFYLIFSVLLGLLFLFLWKLYIDKQKRKRKATEKALQQKNKELKQYTNDLLQKSKEQELLQSKIDKLKTTRSDVSALQELSNSKILTKEDWLHFKTKFSEIYPDYFNKLESSEFSFTNGEKRLISLEKTGLNTDEIANILGISTKSVLTSRYRLRKKLNAPKDISIVNFIDKKSNIKTQ